MFLKAALLCLTGMSSAAAGDGRAGFTLMASMTDSDSESNGSVATANFSETLWAGVDAGKEYAQPISGIDVSLHGFSVLNRNDAGHALEPIPIWTRSPADLPICHPNRAWLGVFIFRKKDIQTPPAPI